MNNKRVWIESVNARGSVSYGMSSGLGATVADLPLNVAPGSDAFDYTTSTVYFFDGKEWIANGN